MFSLSHVIGNPGHVCTLPETAFHPDGSIFAASYTECDEVHIFDAHSTERKQVLTNPAAMLDQPHAVLMTERHLIVSNSHDKTRPSTFNVFRTDRLSEGPIQVMTTPYAHLREAHSMDLRNGILAVSYCESDTKSGAVVTYRFDDTAGTISAPLGITEKCYHGYGDAKGLTYNRDGTLLYVTFTSDRAVNFFDKLLFNLLRIKNILQTKGVAGYVRSKRGQTKKPPRPVMKNGIMVLKIDANGMVDETPVKIFVRSTFCRLENIKIYGTMLIMTDTINNQVLLYDIETDPELEHPAEVLTDAMSMPHGVALSPDRSRLVVTNYGLSAIRKQIHWGYWTKKRGDTILVFDRR